MQANLTRLVDLTAELGRRLKPLGRQAEMARKAAVIQAELRDARLRLLADDYVTLAADLQRDEADEAAVTGPARRPGAGAGPGPGQPRPSWTRPPSRPRPRWPGPRRPGSRCPRWPNGCAAPSTWPPSGTRLLTEATEPERPGRDPDELDRQADELREEEETLTERLTAGREVLAVAAAERTAAEAELAAAERRLAEGAKAAAARRERAGPAARAGRRGGQPQRGRAGGDGPPGGLRRARPRERAALAQDEYEQVQDRGGRADEDRSELAAAHEQAAET